MEEKGPRNIRERKPTLLDGKKEEKGKRREFQ